MIGTKQRIDLRCLIDFEQTPESLHAHVIPQDVEIWPGDEILPLDVPNMVAFGESLTGECHATLLRAGRFERFWTQFRSLFEIAELYEVGFQPLDDVNIATIHNGV
ncbi:hypothetical protein [Acidiphilium sp.]|uniref:hypothetical protein n=1 Tax=Acidiphilium sp. TaxID=527 RepID=UPI003D05C969